jgi:diguanylate cyclase (GGDEF)-like protein/PAS domain S-box-containing protein
MIKPVKANFPESAAVAADVRRASLEAALVCSVAAVAVGAGIIGLWLASTAAIHSEYRERLIGLAKAASAQIDPELHASIRDPAQQNGPEYARAVAPLQRLYAGDDAIKYVYTVVQDGPDIRFVLDAAGPTGDRVHAQWRVWEPYVFADAAMRAVLATGKATATDRPYMDDGGAFMTGYAPIVAADGRQVGAVGVDVDARVYLRLIASTRNWALLGLCPAALVIAGFGLSFYKIRRRGLVAARELAAAAAEAQFAAGVLRLEQERLRHSEHKFRSLFELSPVGIALNDAKTGQFLQVNDALAAPTGYTRDELLQRSYWDLTPNDFGADSKAQLEMLLTTGRYGPYEKEYVRKDGTRYPVLLAGVRLADNGGGSMIWSIVQDISLRKIMESKLAEAARCDKLTGLANRARFTERLQHAIDRVRRGAQQRFAVLFLDCDRFKLVNDTLGHDAGDELLRQIAERLRRLLRASDAMSEDDGGNVVARFGGDEFVLLINDLHAASDVAKLAERLLNGLTAVYTIKGRDVHATASIGIVSSDACMDSPEAVIRNADVAMYEAKRSGRACSLIFNEAMHARVARLVTIEDGLRNAIGTNQLWLAYQPIVDLETGRMASAEALVRWTHPTLGELRPDEFIPVAEESGLIVPLGDWVLVEACRQFAAWRAQAPDKAPALISVNLSRAQLALGEQLSLRIVEVLQRFAVPAECLQLEVTENEVMRDPSSARRIMANLRALGIRLAIDDFGTGTSSLSCLRDYPFDTVKIDRSFVHHLTSGHDMLAVLNATVTLVENLRMVSVAEGVETAAQVAVLQSLGCGFAQGYYFSRPVPADRLLDALTMRAPTRSQIDS